jgi:hypothetical protein
MVIFYKNTKIKCWLLKKNPKNTKSFAIFEKQFATKSLFGFALVFIEIELLHELGLVKLIYFRKFAHILVLTIFFNVYYL